MPASASHQDSPLAQSPNRSGDLFFIFASVVVTAVVTVCAFAKGIPVLQQGPAIAVVEVAKELVASRTFTPQYFHDIYRDAAALSVTSDSVVWQDVFTLDKNGELHPKHSIFSAIAAAPFYALFGEYGFWLLQQFFFLCLLYSTYLLVKHSTGRALPWSTLLSTMLLSQSLFYLHSFNYDLHGCVLIIGGLCLQRYTPFLGAVVMTLSVFVRPANLLLALPLALGTASLADKKRCGKTIAGVVIVLLLFGAYNYFIWGSPFLTAYSRLPSFREGAAIMLPHPIGFDWAVFTSRWGEKLFSSQGLLPYNLSILALPLTFLFLVFERNRVLWAYFLSAVGYSLYVFSYPMWDSTFDGNRFLLPAIYLYLLCFIPMIGRVEARFSPSSAEQKDNG